MPLEPPRDDPAAIRLAHLPTESAVRSVGLLCHLVGGLGALGTLEFALVALGILDPPPVLADAAAPGVIRALFAALAGFMALVAVSHWALGFGLLRRQAWARWAVVALTGLSLVSTVGLALGVCFVRPSIGVPGLVLGVALHLLVLRPLLTTAAGVVFSGGYGEVIRATPQIRVRMHPALKLGLGLALAGLVGLAAWVAWWIAA